MRVSATIVDVLLPWFLTTLRRSTAVPRPLMCQVLGAEKVLRPRAAAGLLVEFTTTLDDTSTLGAA